jgi:zinc protease
MKNLKYLLSFAAILFLAINNTRASVEEYVWNGIKVVYLPQEKLPNYTIAVYFADGALSDQANRIGETQAMFDELTSGTNRYDQKQVADALEFFGASVDTRVTHEYSVTSISGLIKDADPTLKMVCHLFRNSNFPSKELKIYQKQVVDTLNNLTSNHARLADRVFRQVSLSGSIYSRPVEGQILSMNKINSTHLIQKLSYFNDQVKKVIYLTGPRTLLSLKATFEKDCQWGGDKALYSRADSETNLKQVSVPNQIFLLPVEKANQAQVRIGKFLGQEFSRVPEELSTFTSGYLGSGFTSVLMQEIRVKKGLTYGISAYASMQKNYGRAGISTSTRNEKVSEMLSSIKDIMKNLESIQNIETDTFERTKSYLKGNYVLGFEKSDDYLKQIITFDHQGISRELFKLFPTKIDAISKEELVEHLKKYFAYADSTILIVGDKSLLSELKKLGDVKVLNTKDYL